MDFCNLFPAYFRNFHLFIHLHRGYGEETFTVSATFEGSQKVELDLGPEIGRKILELCVDEIVAAVTSVANVAMIRFKGDMAKELPPPSDVGIEEEISTPLRRTKEQSDEEFPF